MKTTAKNTMNEALQASIEKMIVNGTRLELPQDEFFKNYAEVKKTLTKAGGKYKKNGFDFPSCAQAIKDRLLGGESIDDKKKFQFFETPEDIVDQLISLAGIDESHEVLEPSAGLGRIADKVRDIVGEYRCRVVEIMPSNAAALRAKGYDVHEGDFLAVTGQSFDRIVANPPFTKSQDVDHVLHMYSLLKPGGRLVSVMSPSWTFGEAKKQREFRAWLDSVGGEIHELEEGSFKKSGTSVRTVVVVVDNQSQAAAA
jgi:hypothetical protein